MNCNKLTLIIISGLPGTGKTTIGLRLQQELALPYFYRDNIKEILFDTLGYSDHAWSQKLGGASYELLYAITSILMKSGVSCIIESNFPESAQKRIQEIQKAYAPSLIYLHVTCDEKERELRFIQRDKSGNRHPGHIYSLVTENLASQKDHILEIPGKRYHIDTTDNSDLIVEETIKEIKNLYVQ